MRANEQEPWGIVFADENLIELIDTMARRYGKMPTQILYELTIHDFNLNMAIMYVAMRAEADRSEQAQKDAERGRGAKGGERHTKRALKDFGLKVTRK